jgi:hypothetical protein
MLYIDETRVVIWETEDKGNYHLVKMGSSRKDKATGEYKNSNWSFVRFVGKAHDKIGAVQQKEKIVIKGAGISQEPYMKEGVKTYPKNPQIVVFDFEPYVPDGGGKMDEPPAVEEDSNEPLPF